MKNLMLIQKFVLLAAVAVTAVGCATLPEMSPMQRRAIQTRTFDEATYENVFRAFKTVLQDDGYIIKNQDIDGGMILATMEKSTGNLNWTPVFGRTDNRSSDYRMSEGFEVSINIEKLNEKAVESRMTIQKIDQYSRGGRDGREILDEKTYRGFYEKVRVELERRKATRKG